MAAFFRSFILLFFVFSCSHALAGVKGYKVVFLDLTPDQQFKMLFSKYRSSLDASSVSSCWDARRGDWIDVAYFKTQPIKISREKLDLLSKGDVVTARDFSRSMVSYRDDQISSGFDGAYLVRADKSGFAIRGISRGAVFSKYFTVRKNSLNSLDFALCSAASVFDAHFSP
jgi:hypothetical protein